jgi:hypothetical protein
LILLLILLAMAVSIAICHSAARKRGGDPIFWGVMGAFFGPLAIPFVFMIKKKEPRNE